MSTIAVTTEQTTPLPGSADWARLMHAVETGEKFVACRLGLAGRDALQKRLGPNWGACEKFIEQCFTEAAGALLERDDFFAVDRGEPLIFFLAKREAEARLALRHIAANVEKRLASRADFGGDVPGCRWTFLEEAEAKLVCDRLARGGEQQEPDSARERAHRIDYAPLWDLASGRIVGSVCRPETPSALVAPSDDDYYGARRDRMEFDLAALKQILTDLAEARARKLAPVAVFPVNFKTFCAPEYNKHYLQALRQVPPALAALIVPKFVRVPVGVPQSVLADKVGRLAPLFPQLMIQTPPSVQMQRFEHVSQIILTTSWRDILSMAGADKPNMFEAALILDDFRAFTAQRGLKSALEGADTLDAVEIAVSVRTDFVSGAAIGRPDSALARERRLTIDDVRKEAFGAGDGL